MRICSKPGGRERGGRSGGTVGSRSAVAVTLSPRGHQWHTFSIQGAVRWISATAVAMLAPGHCPLGGRDRLFPLLFGACAPEPCTFSSMAEITTEILSSHASAWVILESEPARATNCRKNYNADSLLPPCSAPAP